LLALKSGFGMAKAIEYKQELVKRLFGVAAQGVLRPKSFKEHQMRGGWGQ
jgi:hypothetical protein